MEAVSDREVGAEESCVVSCADGAVISEVEFAYSENSEIGEGSCSCVCINDENCCGCPSQ